jgi:hypothetical protein
MSRHGVSEPFALALISQVISTSGISEFGFDIQDFELSTDSTHRDIE